MSVNYCDTVMFASIPLFVAFAAAGTAQGRGGWLAAVFVAPALAVGVGVAWVGRRTVYTVLGWGLRNCETIRKQWLQQIAFLPFLIWYVVGPWIFLGIGFYGVYTASRWLCMNAL